MNAVNLAAVPTLNPALADFWTKSARNRVLYGGRSASKSWDAAGFAVYLACNCCIRVLCARQFQNRIEESVFTLLKQQISRFGLSDQFRIRDNKISHIGTGSEFIFYGLSRHVDEIKSMEGIDICWVEEAHNLSEEQWDILNPTLRKESSQFWILFNPRLASDFVYRRFVLNPPPGTVLRKITYRENPFLSKTILAEIEACRREDETHYRHIYLGEPRQDDEDAIIKRSWLNAAVGGHTALNIEPVGAHRIGFDIADNGGDLCALVHAHGPLAHWSDLWQARDDELLTSATRAWRAASEREAHIIYDSIGVGASAGAKLLELNQQHPRSNPIFASKFNAGGAVFKPEAFYMPQVRNKDMFANIKAQAWWGVADRLRNTFNAVTKGVHYSLDELIFIDPAFPNLDRLLDELTTPLRHYDQLGRVKVESKRDLASRNVPSPNLADAFIMAFAPYRPPMVISREVIESFSHPAMRRRRY